MENPSFSNNNTVKSRIIKSIIIAVSILLPAVFFNYGVGFLRRWLSPPHIYLILNLVIISIFASPTLLSYLLCIFNYFKEGKSAKQPQSSLSATTIMTSSNGHFYQDWQDFINDQTPTSLSPTEIEPFDQPWPDINEVTSSNKTRNSFHLRERVQERQSAEMVNQSGETETVSPLSLTTDKINHMCEVNDDNTLDSTWKTIMESEERISHPLLNFDESGRTSVPSRLVSPRVPRQDALAAWGELRKSETFNETVSARQRGGMRRDPSLSLEDLNFRVESFIKNFNHQMWLQRQESEQRILEMIKTEAN